MIVDRRQQERRMEEILESLRINSPSAMDDLRKFAADNPSYEDAWAHLAWNLNGLGHIEEAHDAASHLIKLLPNSPDAHRLLAQTSYRLGRSDRAIRSMNQAIRLSGDSFAMRLEMVEMMLRLGRPYASMTELFRIYRLRSAERPVPSRFFQKAFVSALLMVFARALIEKSFRFGVLDRLFRLFKKRGNVGKAYLIARCAASVDPEDGRWAERVADMLFDKRDFLLPEFDEEIVWRNIACRLKVPNAVEKLARVHLHAGHVQTAVSHLKSATDLSLEGQEIFAHSLACSGHDREAIDLYDQLGSNNPMQFVNAGIVALRKKEYVTAISCFEKAIEKDSTHPLAVFLKAISERLAIGELGNGFIFDNILQDQAIKHNWRSRISEIRNDWEQQTRRLLESRRYRIISCPHCGSERFAPAYFDPVPNWVRGQCQNCGFLFANPQPIPEAIPDLYLSESAQGNALQRFFRQLLDEVRSQPPDEAGKMFGRKERWWEPEFSLPDFESERGDSRKLLDVGCSVGTLMYQFQCRGWRVTGIDLDDNAVRLAQSIGLDAQTVTLEEAAFPPESFDLITMMDVIEHVPDHKPLVEKLYSLIKPGGMLRLKTPCPESIVHYQYGPQWISSDMHLLYFSRRILTDGLKRAGFDIVATRSYLEANKVSHSYDGWRRLSVTPLFDDLAIELDIGDTIIIMARKNG